MSAQKLLLSDRERWSEEGDRGQNQRDHVSARCRSWTATIVMRRILTSGAPDLRQCHATIKTLCSFSVKVTPSVFGAGAGEAECSVSTAIVAVL